MSPSDTSIFFFEYQFYDYKYRRNGKKRNKYLCGVSKFIRSNKTHVQFVRTTFGQNDEEPNCFSYEMTVDILFVPYDILKLSYYISGDPKKRSQ